MQRKINKYIYIRITLVVLLGVTSANFENPKRVIL